MNDKDFWVEEGFYRAVADLLGCGDHEYRRFPYRRRSRWNNRLPGNGRYPGHGLVRRFSADAISVNLTSPPICGLFSTETAVLDAIVRALSALPEPTS